MSCWRELMAGHSGWCCLFLCVLLDFFPFCTWVLISVYELFNCKSTLVLILSAFQVKQLCGVLMPCKMSFYCRGTCWSHNCERGGFHLCSVTTKPSLTSSRCCLYSRLWIFWPKQHRSVPWFPNCVGTEFLFANSIPSCFRRAAVSLSHDKKQPCVLTCSSLWSK